MTDRWGIDESYLDASGTEVRIDAAVVARLRELVGEPGEPGTGPLVLRPGAVLPTGQFVIECEDGGEFGAADRLPESAPLGYHRLHPASGGGPSRRLILSPGRCRAHAAWRAWGWAVQLYSARSRDSWGMGDLGDLARIVRWSARQGAGFVLINPLHASAPSAPIQPSPYSPTTRCFRNPIYLRVADVPGAANAAQELARAEAAGRVLNERREIDRDAVWACKLAALGAIWAHRRDDPDFDAWYRTAEPGLEQFATWNVLAEKFGADWRAWPDEYRRPDGPAVAKFGEANTDRIRFHAWLQWLLEAQLTRAAKDLTVIQDLPIGVDPGGADAWAWQDLFAPGVTVGAPPDEFNRDGQDWGLPPFVPWRLTRAGYQPFIDTVRATLSTGGLRIDHVMGLFRLWWVPAGASPPDGGYVRYPSADLLDIIALESHRAGAVVVGEDLGTVEEQARAALAEHDVLSYRLLWFEPEPPSRWPAKAMAAITTHDLPTVAGLWDGSDLNTQHQLGLNPNVESTQAIRARLAEAGGLPDDAAAGDVVLAAHRLLAQAPSLLLTATLEDAISEPDRPNIPGADGKRPNWSLALPLSLEEIEEQPLTEQVMQILRTATEPSRRPEKR